MSERDISINPIAATKEISASIDMVLEKYREAPNPDTARQDAERLAEAYVNSKKADMRFFIEEAVDDDDVYTSNIESIDAWEDALEELEAGDTELVKEQVFQLAVRRLLIGINGREKDLETGRALLNLVYSL